MGGLFSDFGAVFDGNAPRRSLAHTSNLITPVAAKEQKRALRVQQQQGQHSADLAWSHAAAQRQAHQTYVNSMRGQPPSNYFAGMSTTSAQAMYAQYYQQYPAHYYQDGAYAAAAAQAARPAGRGVRSTKRSATSLAAARPRGPRDAAGPVQARRAGRPRLRRPAGTAHGAGLSGVADSCYRPRRRRGAATRPRRRELRRRRVARV